jgi:hypothetical protein
MGQLVFSATSGGQIALSGTNTASSLTITVPAVTGTMVTTGDTGTVTVTMLSATGTPSSTTYLRGDGTWSAISGGVSLSANNTWTGTQTFNGTSSVLGAVMLDVAETVNIVSAAPSSTTNFYIQSGAVQSYTTNAANNWTLNIAFSSGTSLNTALSTGQSITVAMLALQGSTAYYNTAVQVDGTTSGVTTYWQGGTAPTKGNASGIDVYTYTVIKTGSATYTVLASQTQF